MEWCSVGYRQNIAWYSSKDDDDREGISAFSFSVFFRILQEFGEGLHSARRIVFVLRTFYKPIEGVYKIYNRNCKFSFIVGSIQVTQTFLYPLLPPFSLKFSLVQAEQRIHRSSTSDFVCIFCKAKTSHQLEYYLNKLFEKKLRMVCWKYYWR